MNRRSFLATTAVVGAAGLVGGQLLTACSGKEKGAKPTPLREPGSYYLPELPDKAIDGRPLKCGLIGCGGRGNGAVGDLLNAANGITITALGDVFPDRVQSTLEAIAKDHGQEVPAENCFTGFDAYQKVIDSGVDMVIVATPPVFRPIHFQYVVCGTQRHHQRPYVEAFRKIQEGLIGEITGGNVYWNQGMLWYRERQKGWSDMEWMIRDWVNWTWLSGDHIVEQHVHNIDVFNWMNGYKRPVRATAFGSRQRRITGDQYDNFSVDFEYENGVHLHSMCRQIDGCSNNVSEEVRGTKGYWRSADDAIFDLAGNKIWEFDYDAMRATYKQENAYVLEHVDWVNHIRKGEMHNEATECGISSLCGVMGRVAAYTGDTVEWDAISAAELDLVPEKLELGKMDMGKYTVPVPGTGK